MLRGDAEQLGDEILELRRQLENELGFRLCWPTFSGAARAAINRL